MDIYDLSSKIIDVIKSMIDEQIIICDVNGIIIASTDKDRIGSFHEGAALVIKNEEQLIITRELAKELEGVKMGFNLPLFFNKEVIGVIGITGEIQKVRPFGEIVRKMTELLIKESYYNEQVEIEQRAVENFMFDLLQSKKMTRSLTDRAETMNITLDSKKQIILIGIRQEDSILQKELWDYLKRTLPLNDILIRWGNNRLLWMNTRNDAKQINDEQLRAIQSACEKRFSIELYIGVGYIAEVNELYRSYDEALAALESSSATSRILYYTDLQLELCLREISDKTKSEFINRTIGNLLDEKQLLHTLKVFLTEDTSLQKTAEKLFIHINTIHYRLGRIYKLTGLDPRRTKDMLNLYLAIIFLEETTTLPIN